METCGVPTLTCVVLLLVTGAIYASAEDEEARKGDTSLELPLVRVVKSAQRHGSSISSQTSWLAATDSARQGRIADSGGDGAQPVPVRRVGARRGRNRNRGNRGRGNRGRVGGRRRIPNGAPNRLDRRTLNLVHRLSNASTPFALSMFRQLHPSLTADAIFSPLSIHAAMTMTSLGARGRTQREFMQTLGLRRMRLRRMRGHQAYHALLTSLSYTHRDVHVLSASAVFVKPNIPLENTFRQQLQQMYSAKFDTFAPQRPEQAINTWVANATRGKITDLISPGTITPLTAMVLVNTVYLNASWAHPFDARMTSAQAFTSLSQGSKTVQMMQNTQVYRYANHHNVKVVELPYKGDRLAMYVMLPQASANIQELMDFVTGSDQNGLESLLQNLAPTFLKVILPRFKIESELLDLRQPLKDLGIVKAFKRNRANFTAISVVDLHIDKVMHRAMIEVKEGGTTASAATAVYFGLRSSFVRHTEEVRLDRPFMFVIKDKLMNAVLFMGAYLGQRNE